MCLCLCSTESYMLSEYRSSGNIEGAVSDAVACIPVVRMLLLQCSCEYVVVAFVVCSCCWEKKSETTPCVQSRLSLDNHRRRRRRHHLHRRRRPRRFTIATTCCLRSGNCSVTPARRMNHRGERLGVWFLPDSGFSRSLLPLSPQVLHYDRGRLYRAHAADAEPVAVSWGERGSVGG